MASISLGPPIPAEAMQSIVRAMQLRHFKWDTQIGDTSVLFPQPLLMDQGTWHWLSTEAEHAARELHALEQTVAGDPRRECVTLFASALIICFSKLTPMVSQFNRTREKSYRSKNGQNYVGGILKRRRRVATLATLG